MFYKYNILSLLFTDIHCTESEAWSQLHMHEMPFFQQQKTKASHLFQTSLK